MSFVWVKSCNLILKHWCLQPIELKFCHNDMICKRSGKPPECYLAVTSIIVQNKGRGYKLRLVFGDVVSDVRRWSTFSGARASVEAATATIGPVTVATRPPAAATSGGPTVAASAWASSRSGGDADAPPPAPTTGRNRWPLRSNTGPVELASAFTFTLTSYPLKVESSNRKQGRRF